MLVLVLVRRSAGVLVLERLTYGLIIAKALLTVS